MTWSAGSHAARYSDALARAAPPRNEEALLPGARRLSRGGGGGRTNRFAGARRHLQGLAAHVARQREGAAAGAGSLSDAGSRSRPVLFGAAGCTAAAHVVAERLQGAARRCRVPG